MNIPTWKEVIMSIIIAIVIILLCCLSIQRPDEPDTIAPAAMARTVKETETSQVEQEEVSSEVVREVPEEPLLILVATDPPEPAIVELPTLPPTPAPSPSPSPSPSSSPSPSPSSSSSPTSSSKATSTSSSKTTSGLDRSKPLYKVYKGGYEVKVSTKLQWYIRDLCEKYHFYEKYVYGMILNESTFKASTVTGNCIGLCQINKDWLKNENIKRVTKDYKDRDLKDPYDNLLTLVELWNYARDKYNLDLTTKTGMMKVLYWHNTGRNPSNITSSSFFNTCAKFANELVPLQ